MSGKVISFGDAKDRAEGFYRAKSARVQTRRGKVILDIDLASGEGFVFRLSPSEAREWGLVLLRAARSVQLPSSPGGGRG